LIEPLVRKKQRASKIYSLLKRIYPYSKYYLYYTSPHELLVANLLSDHCTRERVNIVSKKLFNKYDSLIDFAYCNIDSLVEDIHSTGNQNEKAEKIKQACLIIVEQYSGVVPCSIDDLLNLPGVGKQTAKCIMGEIYNIPTIVIDTRMVRIMKLLGLTRSNDPKKIESDIMGAFEKKVWLKLSHLINDHGRAVCVERRPHCRACVINQLCPSSYV
jgi:endonuclease-3